MDFNLPKSAVVNTFVPKQTFIKKIANGKAIFGKIEKIIWRYKLSPSTVNVQGTKKVEEIHIFSMSLKSWEIPAKALDEIKRLIPYPILFVFYYHDHVRYGISLLEDKKYYFSEWDEEKEFEFSGTNLENIYQNIAKQFLKHIDTSASKETDFMQTLRIDKKIASIGKQIEVLQGKIRKEKQFNKKTEMNKQLKALKKEIERLNKGES